MNNKPSNVIGRFIRRSTPMIFAVAMASSASFAQQTTSDTGPSWSPDGKLIGFSSNRSGNFEIYSTTMDGKEVKKLTDNPGQDHYPVWSPSGREIAYQSDVSGNNEIYVMNADGSNVRNVTNNPANDQGYVGWSPDGGKIVFHSDRDGNFEVYVMNSDGSGIKRLTTADSWDFQAAFSVDGKSILYTSNDMKTEVTSICSMDLNGENKKVIGEGSFPHLNSNGKTIVFQTKQDKKTLPGTQIGAPEIYLMNADGTNRRNISSNEFWDFYCRLSPDGKRIVFTSIRSDQNQEVYIMDLDGKDVKQLTFN